MSYRPEDVAAERERVAEQRRAAYFKEQAGRQVEREPFDDWWILVAGLVLLFGFLAFVVVHAQREWAREQRHCEATGGVWLDGRDLHKCIYGDNLREAP